MLFLNSKTVQFARDRLRRSWTRILANYADSREFNFDFIYLSKWLLSSAVSKTVQFVVDRLRRLWTRPDDQSGGNYANSHEAPRAFDNEDLEITWGLRKLPLQGDGGLIRVNLCLPMLVLFKWNSSFRIPLQILRHSINSRLKFGLRV